VNLIDKAGREWSRWIRASATRAFTDAPERVIMEEARSEGVEITDIIAFRKYGDREAASQDKFWLRSPCEMPFLVTFWAFTPQEQRS
jgi:hypothetical protein